MPNAIRCVCGKVLEVPDELAGQAVKCPYCEQILKAPGKPTAGAAGLSPEQRRARRRAKRLYLLSGLILFATTLIIVGVVAHAKLKDDGDWGFGSSKRYSFTKELLEPESSPEDRAQAVKPSTQVLDLPAGLLSGLGVGSHSAHLMAAHVGLSYARIGQALYDEDSGVRIQLRRERVTQITVVLKARELDGEELDAFSGEIRPQVTNATTMKEALEAFGQPTDKDETTLTYLTPRRDLTRLIFDPDGTLAMIVLEEDPDQQSLLTDGREAPERDAGLIEPYELPAWEGDANFDLSRQVCLGMPLGAEVASIAGLPQRIRTQVQGVRATYPPTGLMVWFDKKKVSRLAIFIRPGYSQAQLQAFRGTFSHGLKRHMSMEQVREKLGRENAYSELYRLPILHYVMKDRYFQFGFTPDGEKLVFAGMGLISGTEKDLLPQPDNRNIRTARHNVPIWRKYKILAFAEAGSLFRTVCETDKYYGVECTVGSRKSQGWVLKDDVRGADESFVWVGKKSEFQFHQSAGTGLVMDVEFLAEGSQIVACGRFVKRHIPGASGTYNRLCLYQPGRSVPDRSYRSGPITQTFRMPQDNQFLAINNGKVKLTCTIYSAAGGKQLGGGSFSHAQGTKSTAARLSDNGKVLALAWKDRFVLLSVPNCKALADQKVPERILDLAVSKDGDQVWTLHARRVIHWDRKAGTQSPLRIPERRYLYKVPNMPVCLAMAQSRQALMEAVAAYRFPSGEPMWTSDDFYVLPPRLGQTVRARRMLAAPSTKHRLAVALVDLDSGQVIRHVNLETDDTRRLSLSDMRGLKINPKGTQVLAFFRNGLLVTIDLDEQSSWKSYQGFYARDRAVSCTPSGDLVALGYQGVRIYQEGTVVQQFELAVPISAIELSPDGHFVAAGDILGQVHVWDLRKEKKVTTFEENPPLPPISKIRFTMDNRSVLYSAGNYLSLILRSLDPPYEKSPLEQSDKVDHFETSKDGKMALSMSVGMPSRFYLWDLVARKRLRGISYDQPSNWGFVVFDPAEEKAVVMLEGRLHFWHFLTGGGRRVTYYRLADTYNPTLGLLSPNGSQLFSFDDDETRIWDLDTGDAVGTADLVTQDLGWKFTVDGKALVRAVDGKATVLKVYLSGENEEE